MTQRTLILGGTFVYSGALWAQSSASGGPSWELIAVAAVGLVVALIGAYARGISGRVDKTEARLDALKDELSREYHRKEDLNQTLAEMKSSINEVKVIVHALHRRLDAYGIKAAHTED